MVSMLGKPKKPEGSELWSGAMALFNDHLWMPMVLSSSQSTPENKKSLMKVQGVPKAPAKDLHLVSNPHEEARCVDAPSSTGRFPLSRKA
jgi:hypothetical protein